MIKNRSAQCSSHRKTSMESMEKSEAEKGDVALEDERKKWIYHGKGKSCGDVSCVNRSLFLGLWFDYVGYHA